MVVMVAYGNCGGGTYTVVVVVLVYGGSGDSSEGMRRL